MPKQLEAFELKRHAETGRFGIVDVAGKVVLPLEHQIVSSEVSHDLWPVVLYKNDEILLIDGSKSKLSITKFRSALGNDHALGFPVPVIKEKKYGFLTDPGKYNLDFDDLVQFTNSGDFYFYKKSNRWGLVTVRGKKLTKAIFDKIDDQGRWPVKVIQDNKLFLLSERGRLLNAEPFDESENVTNAAYIKFKKNKLVGLMDENGKIKVPAVYQDLDYRNEDFVLIQEKNKWGLVNLKGKTLIKPMYDSLTGPFGSAFRTRIKNQYKWINFQNEEIQTDQSALFERKTHGLSQSMSEVINSKYDAIVPSGNIAILVDPKLKPWHLAAPAPGYVSVVIINKSKQSLVPRSADGSPIIKFEEKVSQETWVDRPEWEVSIDCGLSYANTALIESNRQLVAAVKLPEGKRTLRLRVEAENENYQTEPFDTEK